MLCLWNFEFTEIYGINIFYTRYAKQQCQKYHLINIYLLRQIAFVHVLVMKLAIGDTCQRHGMAGS